MARGTRSEMNMTCAAVKRLDRSEQNEHMFDEQRVRWERQAEVGLRGAGEQGQGFGFYLPDEKSFLAFVQMHHLISDNSLD